MTKTRSQEFFAAAFVVASLVSLAKADDSWKTARRTSRLQAKPIGRINVGQTGGSVHVDRAATPSRTTGGRSGPSVPVRTGPARPVAPRPGPAPKPAPAPAPKPVTRPNGGGGRDGRDGSGGYVAPKPTPAPKPAPKPAPTVAPKPAPVTRPPDWVPPDQREHEHNSH